MTNYELSLVDVQIKKQENNAIMTIELDGEIDMSNSKELRTLLENNLTSDIHELQIDMSKISFVDSSGITLLLALDSETKNAQQSMSVILPQNHSFRHILRIMGIDKVLTIQLPV